MTEIIKAIQRSNDVILLEQLEGFLLEQRILLKEQTERINKLEKYTIMRAWTLKEKNVKNEKDD